jgi:hypothetical protein
MGENESTAVAVIEKTTSLTAQTPQDFNECQEKLVEFFKAKVEVQSKEAQELQENYEIAKKNKWKTKTLKRHAEKAIKRMEYYQKILAALEAGYHIIPNFPVDTFAIRVTRDGPTKWYAKYGWQIEQKPDVAAPGKGEYVNPTPIMHEKLQYGKDRDEQQVVGYYLDDLDPEIEFPFAMAKPEIMEATSRAMAIKAFDEMGALPGVARRGRKRKTYPDPILVGKILEPDDPEKNRCVMFLIAWHIDPRTI